jgi:TolB protein
MRPFRARTALHLLLVAALLPAGASAVLLAQTEPPQGQITGIISAPGLTRLVLAMPSFRLSALTPGAMRDASTEIQSTLAADLEFSGYFDVLPPERYAGISDDASRVPFDLWAGTGAVALLLGSVNPESERLVFEGLLFDTRGEQLILGKRYRGGTDVARQIAHRLANEIVLQFTGRQGIALSHVAFEGRVGKAKEIFLMDYDGHGLRQVTRNGSLNLSPSVSPDGRSVAFVSYKSGTPRLYVLSEESEMKDISPHGAELCAAPSWAPDGRAIAFSSATQGNSDIYVHDFALGTSRRITFAPSSETSPSWSPSGREIAFTSDRSGRPQIYAMDAEGANVRRLTYEGTYNDQAAWSPLGNWIAHAGWTQGHFDIFLTDPITNGRVQLTQDQGFNEHPSWSADGRHLVFTSNRRGIYQLYTMHEDGTGVRRHRTPVEAFGPDWGR